MGETFTIASGKLRAQVLKPGSSLYGRTRFNWSGIVNEIEWDGHRFAEPEQVDPSRVTSGGIGLCSEYQPKDIYETTPVGELYPRLGVGVLTREQAPFNFMKTYDNRPFATQAEAAADQVVFTTRIDPCQGYAYAERREVAVSGDTLRIETTLQNTGIKPIHALEYNHNFLSLDHQPVGPAYKLLLPGFDQVEKIMEGGALVGKPGYLTWSGVPDKPFFNHLTHVREGAPYAWKLTHDSVAASVREVDSFTPVRATVWGVEHCICCEVFVAIDLEPGESMTWTRSWIFDK